MHIITRLDMGGSAQNTMDTCLHLDRREFDVYLIYGLSQESEMIARESAIVKRWINKALQQNVKIIPLESLVRRIDPIKDLKSLFYLWRIIHREKPDIVHTHTSKAGFLGRLVAWIAGVPIIIQTPHGHVFYGHFSPLRSKLFLIFERLTAKITDRLIALTEKERQDYIKFSVAPQQKIVTIHSGVDIDRYMNAKPNGIEKKKSLGLDTDSPIIGFVGWLLPIKGAMNLLKAMRRICLSVPEARLVFVGKGELESILKAEAERSGLADNVKFLGWRDDVQDLMPLFDVFVLPSLNEGMGRVLVEAMAAARPIVASNVGGIPDLIKHGKNGLLVPSGDEKALADSILRLIYNPHEAREMGQNGKEMCFGYNVNAMVDQIDNLYKTLLMEKTQRESIVTNRAN